MKTRKAIFRSVFPVSSQTDGPTPSATPQVDTGSFQHEAKSHFEDREGDDVATRRTRWERAWHHATAFLKLPTSPFSPPDAGNETAIAQIWTKRWLKDASEAVLYLASHNSLTIAHAPSTETRTLVEWYGWEVRRHFVAYQLPVLIETFDDEDARTALINSLQLLEFTQNIYFYPLSELVLPQLGPLAQQHFARFRDWHHAIVSKALETSGFSDCLAGFLKLRLLFIFESSRDQDVFRDRGSDLARQNAAVVDQLKRVTLMVNKVGLGGAQAQQIYAEVLDELVSLHIVDEFSWPNVSGIGPEGRLPEWLNGVLAPLLDEFTAILGNMDYNPDPQRQAKFSDEIENWRTRATHELAAQRLTEAFGIIVNWDEQQAGDAGDADASLPSSAAIGLGEMATFFHTATGRAHVASKLINTISHRLLMPGAATIEILRVYVNIFLAFSEIDKTGLLLARIIRPVRRYLRERDDTVKIIIQALLVDYDKNPADDEALNGFANLVQDLHDPAPIDDESKPLYDIHWDPDPVDAAPEWKADDKPEIFTKLIDIFDNKEVFVKEFQSTLSASLLRGGRNLEQEIRVLELFKSHIGEAQLQACEVMLKDISDSHQIDKAIKKDQQQQAPAAGPHVTARILSRFYWPALNREHMLVPAPVESAQLRYAAGFEAHKPSRKLTWLQNLGQARVRLQLRDRVVEERVQTWQASVIYAFHDEQGGGGGGAPVRKTADELAEELQMDDELVEAALAFWAGRRVLRRDGDAYEVQEELPVAGAPGQSEARGAAEAAGVSAIRRSEQKAADEKMAIFWQFTVNMLRNQGALSLGRIVTMLDSFVPGGFPFSQDEFKAYLAKQIEDRKLEIVGGNYKIVK